MGFVRIFMMPFLLLLLSAGVAQAEGFYASGYGGLNLALISDVDDSRQGIDEISYDPGFVVGGTFGYKFSFQMRLEGDLSYRRNQVDEFEILGRSQSGDGNVNSTAFLVNAFYDFDNNSRWTPYVGGGVGLARVEWDGVEASGGARLDDDVYLGAAQLGGGVAFRVTENFDLTADYRAFATGIAEIDDQNGDEVEIDYVSSSIIFGVRVRF